VGKQPIPQGFSVTVISPSHKNDKRVCNNCRRISLLNQTYKIMAKIISTRFKPYIEEALGE
jgi:hypothetical protein